jgi:hypothetical protein
MEEITTFVNTQLLPHWPFFAVMVIFMVIMQVVKSNVFTKKAHETHKPVWLWWWGRKTLALHPLALGALLGLVWRNPEPGIETLPACMAYFSLSGALSIAAYEVIKGLLAKKGININIPGVDETIPPTEPKTEEPKTDTPA